MPQDTKTRSARATRSKALADSAELNADENDAATPRRGPPPSKTARITARPGRQSGPASRFQSPDWNDGRATAASDRPFASTSHSWRLKDIQRSGTAPSCGRIAQQDRSPGCQSHGSRSRSPLPATRISTGRSTARRSSPIRSRLVRCCARTGSQTKSSPPACFMTCSRRPGLLARSFSAGSEPRIAGLVESVSDDPSIDDYGSRKRELRDRVAHAGSNTVAIFAADKISKVRELTLLPTSRLGETTTRAKLAHYRASLKMLRRVAGNSTLVDLLDTELNRLSQSRSHGTRADGAITGIARATRSKPRARPV